MRWTLDQKKHHVAAWRASSVIFRRTHIDAFFGRVISDAYERSQSDNGRFILLAQGRAPGRYRRRAMKH
ncbi:TPA: hypothetical protein ACHW3K_005376, partial [Escherichia coli]